MYHTDAGVKSYQLSLDIEAVTLSILIHLYRELTFSCDIVSNRLAVSAANLTNFLNLKV